MGIVLLTGGQYYRGPGSDVMIDPAFCCRSGRAGLGVLRNYAYDLIENEDR